jgi:hypothetical protein
MTCGLVALANAMKWKGLKVSYNYIYKRRYKFFPHFDPKAGINPTSIVTQLHKLNIKNYQIINPTAKQLRHFAKIGCSIIIRYRWFDGEETGGHIFFCKNVTKKFIIGYNITAVPNKGKNYEKLSIKEFQSEFRKSFDVFYAFVIYP